MHRILVVSDGTGRTARQALDSALTQFEGLPVEIELRPLVRDEKKVLRVVQEAAQRGACIVHTLVTDEVRHLMLRHGRKHNVETIDLMGPLLARLSNRFGATPAEKPGLFQQLNKDYFRRIETMEFAIRHDDGNRVEELRKAEIVLLGVSRTFKTPLSIYLAFKGWFSANVPIVMGRDLPKILYRLPARKVFGLDTNVAALAELRKIRSEHLGGQLGEYDDYEHIRVELMHARDIYARHPEWSVINVTRKPIEEIASELLALRKKRRGG